MIAATISSLVRDVRFGAGVGLLALAVGVAAWAITGRRLPLAGLLMAGASLIAIEVDAAVPTRLLIGVGLLAYAGILFDVGLVGRRTAVVASIPGAWLLAMPAGRASWDWVPWAVGSAAVVGGWLVVAADERWAPAPLTPVLVAVSAAGIWACVPDTDQAAGMAGAALATAPLGIVGARLGGGGALAIAGLFAWVAASGGAGRAGSVVGALAALGLLVAVPALGALARRGTRAHWGVATVVGLALVHLAAVLAASRFVGAMEEASAALPTALVVLAAAGAVALVVERATDDRAIAVWDAR